MVARNRDGAIILKSDSAYLVNGITEYTAKWKTNGWVNAAGRLVANKQLWEELETRIRKTKQRGTRVLFWQVPREWNKLADALANDAFLDDEDLMKYRVVDEAKEEYKEERGAWMEEYATECKELGYVGTSDEEYEQGCD